MKRLLLAICGVIFLTCVGAVPSLHARKQDPQAQGTNANEKHHWYSMHHREKSHKTKAGKDNREPLHTTPNSVGWWHPEPGPAGAGAK
jgi:hypothetical protein